ncbi:hypothetical protein HHI36_021951 [Cryptolaemus montrouzieri]|uniref:Uncharacterized protein n=1 Tax=Cryptolaemus montrouzieri TaxID=559131 RepID=A0ABD2MYL3_9CUCU
MTCGFRATRLYLKNGAAKPFRPPRRKLQEIIQDLFPRKNEIPNYVDRHTERQEEIMANDDETDITEEEVSKAIETMKKAPGPDGVTTEVVIWI